MAIEDWLRLALAPDVGPALAHHLLDAFDGDPAAIFRASAHRLESIRGVGRSRLDSLMDRSVIAQARDEAQRAAGAGVHLIPLDHPDYPVLLRRLARPPLLLWARGRLQAIDRLALAMVGPRAASGYGRLMAVNLAGPLAAHGLTLISGLAGGVDAEVHRAALDSRGRTLAVLGQGLGTPISPALNRELADRMLESGRGALLSIFPMETQPQRGLFPQRNEILAGMALATLVVEASPSSGALITARHAASHNRPVLACPGDATRRTAQGSNQLLADGAALVQSPADVLGAIAGELRREMLEMNLDALPGDHAHSKDDGCPIPQFADGDPSDPDRALDAALLNLLRDEPYAVDRLIEALAGRGHDAGSVQQRLLLLELDGRIRQMPGRLYALKT
jgi:DNA processing protein